MDLNIDRYSPKERPLVTTDKSGISEELVKLATEIRKECEYIRYVTEIS